MSTRLHDTIKYNSLTKTRVIQSPLLTIDKKNDTICYMWNSQSGILNNCPTLGKIGLYGTIGPIVLRITELLRDSNQIYFGERVLF